MITKKLFTVVALSSALIAASGTAFAEDATVVATGQTTQATTLDSKLEELKLPENTAPASVSTEQLYSVQNRYSNLKFRSEISVGGTRNFVGNTFINSNQIDLTYRFHLSNRWNLALGGSYAFNTLTEGAQALYQQRNILPDAAFVKYRADLLAGFNVFYGKLRFTMEKVVYFDQYLAIGPGLVKTQYGTVPAAVADIGLVFWTGQKWSMRFGVKNTVFNEKRMLSSSMAYHLLGHLDIGFLFGSGNSPSVSSSSSSSLNSGSASAAVTKGDGA